MARFYVGRRIKITHAENDQSNVGREAVVIRAAFAAKGTPTISGQRLSHDCHYEISCIDNGDEFAVSDWQITPITDCYDTTTWDQCIWRPEHMRTEA